MENRQMGRGDWKGLLAQQPATGAGVGRESTQETPGPHGLHLPVLTVSTMSVGLSAIPPAQACHLAEADETQLLNGQRTKQERERGAGQPLLQMAVCHLPRNTQIKEMDHFTRPWDEVRMIPGQLNVTCTRATKLVRQ